MSIGWEPFTEHELSKEIVRGLAEMTPAQRLLWDAIKIRPTKWQLSPWGDEGDGFWVVAILGSSVIWYTQG